jgi:nucleoside-diphosphate-sugar epimerase
MKAIVTGAAGFIGSALCRALLTEQVEVVGIDKFTPYYSPQQKWRNVVELQANPRFSLVQADLVDADLLSLYDGATVVFHLAGQPGVRSSWADGFDDYVIDNVCATQRVLEAARADGRIRVVYASSSSVYGNAGSYPCRETDLPQPYSPYGVTKLAGEQLAVLYARNFGVSTVSLRFFTVYGPRQRPEMAMARLVDAALTGSSFTLFAAPGAVRDFTYVDDVVRAVLLAGFLPALRPGLVANVCGGAPAGLHEVITALRDIVGTDIDVEPSHVVAGDVVRTGGDSSVAHRELGWTPRTDLREGLFEQVLWRRAELGVAVPSLSIPEPSPLQLASVRPIRPVGAAAAG